MENVTDPTLNGGTIDQTSLNNLLSNPQSLIPESMQTLLVVGFILINVATIVFIIAYIFTSVRRWRVQTAILKMHKDMIDIKQSLATMAESKTVNTPTVTPAPPRVIAVETTPESSPTTNDNL